MRKRGISILIILTIMLGVLAGCSNDSNKKKADLEKVTVILDWLPNTNHTGLYVAKEKGYYEAEGLDVEIVQPAEGGSADLVAAGQGQFGISYQEQVTYGRTTENPLPIRAIGAIIQHNTSGMASPVAKGIKSPLDFEGKKYGGFGSPIEEQILKALMDREGADYEKVELLDIGASDFFTSVENHVDFSWIFYGWDGVAAELRDIDLNFIKLQDIEPNLDYYTPVIISQDKLLEERPELAEKFMRASSKGYELAIENPEEAADILLKEVPELDRDLVVASQKYLAKEYKAEAKVWGHMKEEIWANYSKWMYENGLLENQLDVDKAFTNKFLPKE